MLLMNNNILLEKPKVKFETHARTAADYPFIIRRHADHSISMFGIHENLELLLYKKPSFFGAALF